MPGRTLTAGELVQLARGAGWSLKDAPTAAAIALAESSGRTHARGGPNSNGSYDYGLWQINSVHGADKRNWSDPSTNAAMAYAVYRSQGWRAWTVYKTGAYAVYLPRTRAAASQQRGGYVPGAGGGAAPGGASCPKQGTRTKTPPQQGDKRVYDERFFAGADIGSTWLFATHEAYRTPAGCFYFWDPDDKERIYMDGPPSDPLSDAAGAVGDVVEGAADMAGAVVDLISWLSHGDNWLRIVWVVSGGALAIGAVIVVAKGQIK